MYDDFIFPVDFGLVILLAYADSIIKFFDHTVGLIVEIVDVGIFNRNSGCVSLSDTVDDCIKIILILVELQIFVLLLL
jgi:hypothetical protein